MAFAMVTVLIQRVSSALHAVQRQCLSSVGLHEQPLSHQSY